MLPLSPRGVATILKQEVSKESVTLQILSVSPGGFVHISDGAFFASAMSTVEMERGDVICVTSWTRKSQSDQVVLQQSTLLQKNTDPVGKPRLFLQAGRRLSQPQNIPVASLSLLVSVKGRVISVSSVRPTKNNRVQFFTADLLDLEGHEHRLVFFVKDTAEKCREEITLNSVYCFQGGQTKGSEIVFYKFPIIEKLPNDPRIPSAAFREPTKISDLLLCPISAVSSFDLLGLVLEVSQVREVAGKQSTPLHMRKLKIVDDSLACIELVLWGDRALAEDVSVQTALGAGFTATKCILREFRDERSVSLTADGQLRLEHTGNAVTRCVQVVIVLEIQGERTPVKNLCGVCSAGVSGSSDGVWACVNNHATATCKVEFNLHISVSLPAGPELMLLSDAAAAKLVNLQAEHFQYLSDSEKLLRFRSCSGRRFLIKRQLQTIVDLRPLVC